MGATGEPVVGAKVWFHQYNETYSQGKIVYLYKDQVFIDNGTDTLTVVHKHVVFSNELDVLKYIHNTLLENINDRMKKAADIFAKMVRNEPQGVSK